MAGLIVGQPEFTPLAICNAIWNLIPDNGGISSPNLIDLARQLEIPVEDHNFFTPMSNREKFIRILSTWKSIYSKGVTLGRLLDAFRKLELNAEADQLQSTFMTGTLTNNQELYDNPPNGLEEFRESEKRVLILCSLDKAITEKRIRDTIMPPVEFLECQYLSRNKMKRANNKSIIYVITCTQNIKMLLRKLQGIQAKIVLITEQTFDEINKTATSNLDSILTIQEKINWEDLRPSFQNVLKNTLVKLQNKVIPVEEIIGEDPDESLDIRGQTLIDIINRKMPKLISDKSPEHISYYIERSMISRRLLNPAKIFVQELEDIFLFTGMEHHELSNKVLHHQTDTSSRQRHLNQPSVNYMILDLLSDFDDIAKKTCKSVHIIHHQDGKFYWRRSCGKMENIHQSIEAAGGQQGFTEQLILEEFSQIEAASTICISDTPGMGKSILLRSLFRNMQKLNPENIFILMEFSKFISRLKEKSKQNSDTTLELQVAPTLAALAETEKLGQRLLLKALNSETTQVEVMLDGYDEVHSEDQELVKKYLDVLKLLPATRIWVTTRPHLLHDLENCLQVLGYNIQPFSHGDQVGFLTKFWENRASTLNRNIDQARLETFINHCLKTMNDKLRSKERDIAGIPLQCMLIAEVFEDDAINYSDPLNVSNQSFPAIQISSITELFQRMSDTKLDKYFKIYPNSKYSREELIQAHIILSLQLLFPSLENAFQNVLIANPRKMLVDLLNVGLLEQLGEYDVPQFIHRLFAEYFTALFAHQLIRNQSSGNSLVTLFSSIFETLELRIRMGEAGVDEYNFKLPVLCHFLDNMLQSTEAPKIPFNPNYKIIHSCVESDLPNLFNFLYTLLEPHANKAIIFDEDLVFVAVRYSSAHFLSHIFQIYEACHHLKSKDLVVENLWENFSLLKIALKFREYPVVEYLVKTDGVRELIESNYPSCMDLLHFCASGSISETEFLIKEKIKAIRFLVGLNKSLLETHWGWKSEPMYCMKVHPKLRDLMNELRESEFTSEHEQYEINVPRLWADELTPTKFDRQLKLMPRKVLSAFSTSLNPYNATPLEFALQFWDPELSSLKLFAEVGAIQATGAKLILNAVWYKRSIKTLEALVNLGATWQQTDEWTILHDALRCGNFPAFRFISLHWTNDQDITEHLSSAREWEDIKNMDLGALNLNWSAKRWNERGTFLDSIVSHLTYGGNTYGSTMAVLNLLVRNGSTIDFKNLTSFNLDHLNIFDSAGAITSHEKASLCLRHMASRIKTSDISEFETTFKKISSKCERPLHQTDQDGETLLHTAVRHNNQVAIRTFIKFRVNMFAQNKYLLTPIECLWNFHTEYLSLEIINLFDQLGAINSQKTASVALGHIIRNMKGEDKAACKDLADRMLSKINKEVFSRNGFTYVNDLLDIVGRDRNIVGVKYIFNNCVLEGNRAYSLKTLIRHSWKIGYNEAIELLRTYESYWSPLTRLYKTRTMLHSAVKGNHLEIIKYLVTTKLFDDISRNIVEYAAGILGIDSRLQVFKFLYNWHTTLPGSSDVQANNFLKEIRMAGGCSNVEVVEFLLEIEKNKLETTHLAEIFTFANHSNTSNTSKIRSQINILKLIALRNCCLLDKPDKDGIAPILNKGIPLYVLMWLLSHVSNPRAVNSEKMNVAFVALEYLDCDDYHRLVEHLIRIGCGDLLIARGGVKNATVLHEYLKMTNIRSDTLSLFQENQADFNAVDDDGESVLMSAIPRARSLRDNTWRETLKKLIQFGSGSNIFKYQGASVLNFICSECDPDHLELIIRSSDINAQDKNGNTPLHLATSKQLFYSFLSVLNSLIENGASRTTRNLGGQLPYDVAVDGNKCSFTRDVLKPKSF